MVINWSDFSICRALQAAHTRLRSYRRNEHGPVIPPKVATHKGAGIHSDPSDSDRNDSHDDDAGHESSSQIHVAFRRWLEKRSAHNWRDGTLQEGKEELERLILTECCRELCYSPSGEVQCLQRCLEMTRLPSGPRATNVEVSDWSRASSNVYFSQRLACERRYLLRCFAFAQVAGPQMYNRTSGAGVGLETLS